jgi:N6-L-threonylcarbamoyladenine synthase
MDNGAMVAALGAQLVMAGIAPSGVTFAPDSSMPVTTVSAPGGSHIRPFSALGTTSAAT